MILLSSGSTRSFGYRVESSVAADRAGRAADPFPNRRSAMSAYRLLAAPIDLHRPAHYVHWGVVQISVPNLIVIGLMVLVFVLAVLVPFPKGRGR